MDPVRIRERDGYRCLWCRKRFASGNLEIHHLVPHQLDGPDADWNLTAVCRHHHIILTQAHVRPIAMGSLSWWEPGEADCALGKCFAAETARRGESMPEHVEDAITDAFRRMCSGLPDRFYEEDAEWDLAGLINYMGNPLMSAGAF